MKYFATFFVVLFAGTTLLLADINVAEAKRLGGGQSFGSKFSHSQPVKKNSAEQGATQARPATPAQQRNNTRQQELAQRGGMMGMLGALALGGMLGALFFGGAFEGINLMDLLVIGLIVFLLYKLMARRPQPASAAGGGFGAPPAQHPQHYEPATNYSGADKGDAESLDMLRKGAPGDFDQAAFLDGARRCFERLQRAWDEGDLADIRQFTTDHVFGEIQEQYRARAGNSRTEIASLEAELLSASDLGSRQEAIVLFRARLREDNTEQSVDEVWHFVRPANGHRPTWFLDGIQQVEG